MRFHRCWSVMIGMAALFHPIGALAHCDGLDGPVVKAAARALETGEVSGALIWVQKEAETEVKAAFDKSLSVRKLSPEARELADRYFFETLVRIHRAGEGEPYTGLKPAGRDLGPAIPAADKAVASESPEHLIGLITSAVRHGVEQRLAEVVKAKAHAAEQPADVERGRHFVKAYVALLHYVERSYDAAASAVEHGHQAEPAKDH